MKLSYCAVMFRNIICRFVGGGVVYTAADKASCLICLTPTRYTPKLAHDVVLQRTVFRLHCSRLLLPGYVV